MMISSQGKKQLSLTMQIWNWNGKKEQSGLRTEWMSLFWHGFFTIYAFGIRLETSLGKPWVLIDAFFFFTSTISKRKAFSQIVCLSRKIFNFLFGFSETLHFTPLINPSWVELSQEVVQGAKTTVVCYESWWFTLATTLCHSLWNLSCYSMLLQKQL